MKPFTFSRLCSRLFAWATVLAILLFARTSLAIPEAHILRIDPRAGVTDGQPILTTVIELVQFTPMSEVVTNAGCGSQRGDGLLDCISNAVEQKNVMWKAFQFPDPGARLLVRVDGGENPAKLASKATWGASTKDPLVGTAWLIALDASSLMGPRYADAREVANQIINAMGPNDIAKLIIFDDRISPYVANSSWVAAAQKAQLVSILQANPSPSPSHQRARPLFNQIKNITKSFGDLGNTGGIQNIPMHQAMVLLSNGAGREDAASAAISAEALKQYFNKGRFPEDNPLAPKTPLPVISIFFPSARGFTNDIYAMNDMQFMQDIANPEIGGFFDIVRTGQGVTKATTILSLVKSRFNAMWVVKWRLSCLASTAEQTFNLVFQGGTPVKPDGSFKDVPIGVDPTSWPLDINMAQTKAEADANPVHPGGTFRVYGDFCWGGDKNRAEAYFVPAGTSPNQNVNRNDPEVAKKAIQHLVAQNLRGGAVEAGDTFALFNVPDEDKLLEGEGENMITRVVVYDNKAKRGSGVTAETVITLKASKKPLNLPIILGAAGIVVVILLLVVVLLRGGGGGGKGKRANQPPPAPVVAGGPPYGGPPYGGGGAPPYGGGAPPYGGGGGGYQPPPGGYGSAPQAHYGAHAYGPNPAPMAPPAFAGPPLIPPHPDPPLGGGGYPLASAGGAPVEVRCPACNMTTLAMPGQASVCFSCGQPLPRDIATAVIVAPPSPPAPAANVVAAGVSAAPAFPLTSAHQAPQLEPPPNPYGNLPTSATIVGAAGQFAIRGGVEVRVGRDPAACPITLAEPRVSGVHATLKFEGGQLMVRDESSNNGTYVSGARIPAQSWTPVSDGASLRFGPVEFTVKID
ncbi:MAG TPA: FHA domain-containing protein [Labilithrix sp.]|nr:FHA domain-containing protein [Labilithrix sp.]